MDYDSPDSISNYSSTTPLERDESNFELTNLPPEIRQQLSDFSPSMLVKLINNNPDKVCRLKNEQFIGAIALVDISGFTKLSTRLAEKGNDGIEELMSHLNAYFGQLIEIVNKCGGDIIAFAGDALIACWPVDKLCPIGTDGDSQDTTHLSVERDEIQQLNQIKYTFTEDNNLNSPKDSPDKHLPRAIPADRISSSSISSQNPPSVILTYYEKMQFCAIKAIECSLDIQKTLPFYDSNPGETNPDKKDVLTIHIAIGIGQCTGMHVGGYNGAWFWLVGGSPFKQIHTVDQYSKSSDVVVGTEVYSLVKAFCKVSQVGDLATERAYKIISVEKTKYSTLIFTNNNNKRHSIAREILCYTNPSVLATISENMQRVGETRPATVLFIGCQDIKKYDSLKGVDIYTRTTQQTCELYNAIINKVLIDEKGCTIIVVLGLPPAGAHQDDPTRGALFALTLKGYLTDLGLNSSIGIASGRIFCGVYGKLYIRREYCILGSTVNMAARLMGFSVKDILVDHNTYMFAKDSVNFETWPPIMLKGIADPVRVYRPIKKLISATAAGTSSNHKSNIRASESIKNFASAQAKFIGRKHEIDYISNTIFQLKRNGTAPMRAICIDGIAGSGKTAIGDEALKICQSNDILNYYYSSDVSAQRPFSAFYNLLTMIFEFKTYSGDESVVLYNRNNGVKVLEHLKQHPTLIGLAPLFNEILGKRANIDGVMSYTLFIEDSDICCSKTMSEAERQMESIKLVSEIIIRYFSKRRCVVFILDDVEWFDIYSWMALQVIIFTLPNSLSILFSKSQTRYTDPNCLQIYNSISTWSSSICFELSPLTKDEISKLAALLLGIEPIIIPPSVLSIIVKKSEGRPQFVKELVMQMIKLGMVSENQGSITILDNKLFRELDTGGIEGGITQKIDALSKTHQYVVKVASCIGQYFDMECVRYVLQMIGNTDVYLDSIDLDWDETCRELDIVKIEQQRNDTASNLSNTTKSNSDDSGNNTSRPSSNDSSTQGFGIVRSASTLYGEELSDKVYSNAELFNKKTSYKFKNESVEKVAYRLLLNKHRTEIHNHVAKWLKLNFGKNNICTFFIATQLVQAKEYSKACKLFKKVVFYTINTCTIHKCISFFTSYLRAMDKWKESQKEFDVDLYQSQKVLSLFYLAKFNFLTGESTKAKKYAEIILNDRSIINSNGNDMINNNGASPTSPVAHNSPLSPSSGHTSSSNMSNGTLAKHKGSVKQNTMKRTMSFVNKKGSSISTSTTSLTPSSSTNVSNNTANAINSLIQSTNQFKHLMSNSLGSGKYGTLVVSSNSNGPTNINCANLAKKPDPANLMVAFENFNITTNKIIQSLLNNHIINDMSSERDYLFDNIGDKRPNEESLSVFYSYVYASCYFFTTTADIKNFMCTTSVINLFYAAELLLTHPTTALTITVLAMLSGISRITSTINDSLEDVRDKIINLSKRIEDIDFDPYRGFFYAYVFLGVSQVRDGELFKGKKNFEIAIDQIDNQKIYDVKSHVIYQSDFVKFWRGIRINFMKTDQTDTTAHLDHGNDSFNSSILLRNFIKNNIYFTRGLIYRAMQLNSLNVSLCKHKFEKFIMYAQTGFAFYLAGDHTAAIDNIDNCLDLIKDVHENTIPSTIDGFFYVSQTLIGLLTSEERKVAPSLIAKRIDIFSPLYEQFAEQMNIASPFYKIYKARMESFEKRHDKALMVLKSARKEASIMYMVFFIAIIDLNEFIVLDWAERTTDKPIYAERRESLSAKKCYKVFSNYGMKYYIVELLRVCKLDLPIVLNLRPLDQFILDLSRINFLTTVSEIQFVKNLLIMINPDKKYEILKTILKVFAFAVNIYLSTNNLPVIIPPSLDLLFENVKSLMRNQQITQEHYKYLLSLVRVAQIGQVSQDYDKFWKGDYKEYILKAACTACRQLMISFEGNEKHIDQQIKDNLVHFEY